MRYTDADRESNNVIRADRPPENEWFMSRLVREAFSPRVDPVDSKPFPFPVPDVDLTRLRADADEIRANMEKNKLPVDANGKLIFPRNSLDVGQDWLAEQIKNPRKPQKEEPLIPIEIPPLENPPKMGDQCRPNETDSARPAETNEDTVRPSENTANPNEVRPIDQSTTNEQSIRPVGTRVAEPNFLDMSSPY